MSGLVKQVWMACTIAFVLLLPYVVLKRRLWFPGLVVVAYRTFGWAKLTPAKWGPLRVWHLVIMASILIIGGILLERKQQVRPACSDISLSDRAPVFLVILMFLMLMRMLAEYLYTGHVFLLQEMTDSVVETLLPCLILVLHPGQEDAFPEVLQGIALGGLLALLPAFIDFETLSDIWAELTSGSTAHYYDIGYRSRGTIAYWATQGAISLFHLCVLQRVKKGRWYYHLAAASLVAFALITQGRTWFLILIFFAVLHYLRWLRSRETSIVGAPVRKSLKPLLAIVLGCSMLYLVFLAQSRFERYTLDYFVAELGPSFGVPASRSRRDLLLIALDAWREHPWLGGGLSGSGWVGYDIEPGTGRLITHYVGTHYMATDVLVQYGIVGALFGIAFLMAMFCSLAKWLKAHPNSHLQKELSLLTLYWVALLPAALGGAWDPHRLGLVGLLPCAAWLIIRYDDRRAAFEEDIECVHRSRMEPQNSPEPRMARPIHLRHAHHGKNARNGGGH